MPVKKKKTGKGKRRANGRKKNKKQRKVTTRQNTKTLTKPSKQQNFINHPYHCFVETEERKPLWSVLYINDASIDLYVDKLGELEGIPYDSINLLSYHKIKKDPFAPLWITLLTKNQDLESGLSFIFRSKSDRNYWYDTITKIICCHGKQSNENGNVKDDILADYTDSNVLYFGDVLFNNKQLLIMVLTTFSNNLYFYKKYDNKYKNRILVKKIDLLNCKEIILTNKKSLSLFKHKLILKFKGSENETDILLNFKKNNQRQEWFAHFDFIMYRKINTVIDDKSDIIHINDDKDEDSKQTENKLNNESTFNKSFILILKILNMYDENNESTLNISYIDILNHFNNIIKYFHSNKVNDEFVDKMLKSQNCTKIECAYVNRHTIKRNKNERNKRLLMNELLDKIHCFIFHSNPQRNRNGINNMSNRNIITNRNLTNKFVINTHNQQELQDKKTPDPETNHDNEENIHSEPLTFAFGEIFTFYEDMHKNFVNAHFQTLKDELTSNPYYKLSENEYYTYYINALNIKRTKHFRNIAANDHGPYNELAEIAINDKISINHIISLMTYCNEDELQRIFKKQTRKSNKNELTEHVFKKVSFICHWIRYLSEACVYYGQTMKLNEFVYCGIDKKLIFNTFKITNYSPFSTSSDICVANTFASDNGIILQLKRNESGFNSRYFDMSFISNFVHEKELFFCGVAKLSINDIIICGKSNVYKISSLKLLELILNGHIFVYKFNKSQFTKNIINGLVYLLDEYIKNENKKEYFLQLTTALIESYLNRNKANDPFGRKMIFINTQEINKLNNKLLASYFLPSSVLIHKFNQNGKKPNYIKKIFKFELNKRKLNRLKKLKCDQDITIILADFVLEEYEFRCYVDKIKTDYVGICIQANPRIYSEKEVSMDIVCEQVEYQISQVYRIFSAGTDYFAGVKLFPASKLCGLNYLSINLNIRVI